LNGQARAIVLNIKEGFIELVSDPFGLNFLYYMRGADSFTFASEMKFLLSYDPSLCERVNRYAIVEYALLHYVLGDKTFFEDVHLLSPASVLKVDLGSFDYEIKNYLSFPSEYSEVADYSKALRRAKDLFVRSVNKRTIENAKLMLSGGLDSRIILASINPKKRKTISCINFGNTSCDDVRFARLIAERFQMNYNFHNISAETILKNMERHIWITEGGSNHLVSYLIPILEKESPTAILDGYLGDAIYGASYLDKVDVKNASIQKVFQNMAIPKNIQKIVFTREFYNEIQKYFYKSLKIEADRYSNVKDAILKIEYAMMNNRGRRYINCGSFTVKHYCPDLKPFFDKDFFEFYIKIPYHYRLKHKFYFDMIKQEYPELLSFPSTTTQGKKIEKSLWDRITLKLWKLSVYAKRIIEKFFPISLYEKNTYVPIDFWLRENREYRNRILDLLISPRTIKRGFFSKDGILRLLKEHDEKRHNYGWYFVLLADFELFHRLFIDGDGLRRFLK